MKRYGARELALGRILQSPQTALLAGFAGVILVGALVLRHPICHRSETVSFVDALFTSTSAVCVTGLTVVDTETAWTRLGQFVILVLIQTGGLGVMTFAMMAYQVMGRRLSLRSQAVLQDSFFQKDVAQEFHHAFRMILILTIGIEGIGALLLFMFMAPTMSLDQAVFSAAFHAISAFCNAGFSLYSTNAVALRDSVGSLFVIMALIVLGGLGYVVLIEIWKQIRGGRAGSTAQKSLRFSLHARVVFRVTAFLIVGGTLALILFGMTSAETTWSDLTIQALFQSISSRTAGFNSCDIGKLPNASLFALVLLMFIGGSPASCAGGIKTTTLAIWLARVRAGLLGRSEVRLLDRSLNPELVSRTDLLIALAIFWNTAGILFLLTSQSAVPAQAIELIFEHVSAFGTVGLSTGITPQLTIGGKLWIVATMYVGRLGPLTVAMWMVPKSDIHVHYPKATVMIG